MHLLKQKIKLSLQQDYDVEEEAFDIENWFLLGLQK